MGYGHGNYDFVQPYFSGEYCQQDLGFGGYRYGGNHDFAYEQPVFEQWGGSYGGYDDYAFGGGWGQTAGMTNNAIDYNYIDNRRTIVRQNDNNELLWGMGGLAVGAGLMYLFNKPKEQAPAPVYVQQPVATRQDRVVYIQQQQAIPSDYAALKAENERLKQRQANFDQKFQTGQYK